MKSKLLALLSVSTIALIACNGGGGDTGGGAADNHTDGDLPPTPAQYTYAYVTSIDGYVDYHPIFSNTGNIDWNSGGHTGGVGGGVKKFVSPQYIVVNDDSSIAYILDTDNGKNAPTIYACNINRSTTSLRGSLACNPLSNITNYLDEPKALALYNGYIYISNNVPDGVIVKCNIDGSNCSLQPTTKIAKGSYRPWGIAVNNQGAFVSYTATSSNSFLVYGYTINSDGSIGSGKQSNSSSTISGPTQIAINGSNNLLISSTGTSAVSQYTIPALDVGAAPVSTIFKSNYEISLNKIAGGATFAYIANTLPNVTLSGQITIHNWAS